MRLYLAAHPGYLMMAGAAPGRRLFTQALCAAGALEGMPVEVVDILVENGHERTFAGGETLMRQGDPPDCLYVILSGRVRVDCANAPDQAAVVLAELGPGELVGELEVLDRTPRSATVVALERVAALEVAASAVGTLAADNPALAAAFRSTISRRLHKTNLLAAELFTDLLRKVPMFGDVSPASLSKLAERGRLRTFAPGMALMRQGEPGSSMSVLAAGRVRIERSHPSLSSPIPLAELNAGEVVGELEVLDGAPRAASVIAIDYVEAMELDASALADTMAHCPDVATALLRSVARRLRSTDELLDHLAGQSERRAPADEEGGQ